MSRPSQQLIPARPAIKRASTETACLAPCGIKGCPARGSVCVFHDVPDRAQKSRGNHSRRVTEGLIRQRPGDTARGGGVFVKRQGLSSDDLVRLAAYLNGRAA